MCKPTIFGRILMPKLWGVSLYTGHAKKPSFIKESY